MITDQRGIYYESSQNYGTNPGQHTQGYALPKKSLPRVDLRQEALRERFLQLAQLAPVLQ
jgi:hypothetical protein